MVIKGFFYLAREKYIDKELAWLQLNNCCKGAVAYLYKEEGTTGIMFYHQTGGPITGWVYMGELAHDPARSQGFYGI